MTTKLSISVVLFHTEPTILSNTLESLLVATKDIDCSITLWLIDQSDHLPYADRVRHQCEHQLDHTHLAWRWLGNVPNEGYGAGHNRVPVEEMGDLHLILNPDVTLHSDALAVGLNTFSANPTLVLAAPKGLHANGNEDYLAKRYPTALVLLCRALKISWLTRYFSQRLADYEYHDLTDSPAMQPITLASGCFMLVKSRSYIDSGRFDAGFFLYWEDYDLCMRMADKGLIARLPHMQIIHDGGGAADKGWRHIGLFTMGAIRFFNRWGWKWW